MSGLPSGLPEIAPMPPPAAVGSGLERLLTHRQMSFSDGYLPLAHKIKVAECRTVRTLWRVPQVSEGLCPGCNKPLEDEETVDFHGQEWHFACFRCSLCRTPFNDSCIPKDDLILHHECFLECFSERCTICTDLIPPRRVTDPRASLFHVHCFGCIACGDRDAVYGKTTLLFGLPYCMRCFERSSNVFPRCVTCKRIIMPGVQATPFYFQGSKFVMHGEPGSEESPCCACNICGEQVTVETARSPDRSLLCAKCYERGLTRICCVCNEPIYEDSPPSLAPGLTDCGHVWFHHEHFVCVNRHPLHAGDRPRYENGILRCTICVVVEKWTCPNCGVSGKDHPQTGLEGCGHFWHFRCFHCQFCKRNIAQDSWIDVRGSPCCMQCKTLRIEDKTLDTRGRPLPRTDWQTGLAIAAERLQKKDRKGE